MTDFIPFDPPIEVYRVAGVMFKIHGSPNLSHYRIHVSIQDYDSFWLLTPLPLCSMSDSYLAILKWLQANTGMML